ncbi:putative HTH-type transcriptional regulator YraN [Geobacillus sp. PA-3]|uniref:LysR family transcriptional regulator n=1 Tax=Geobacillus sp. PA-3 TaxID=1699078 RepID=UPI0006E6F22E|nr:LysR family transcriptional regulator [Geobacillus sp. PA-3]KQB91424.1 putative HTH-type transcriptional regulator YraN [Geobacillus sp. PA-3]
MDEKDWVILKTIYEDRNITKASERLYISQPSLTYRIKQLEKEFGVKILSRGKKGVEFTEQGEYLVRYADNMLSILEKIKEQLNNMDDKVKGTLKLAVSRIYARYELPNILSLFLKKYPEVDIQLKTGFSSVVYQMLHREEAHVGIVRGNQDWDGHKVLISEEKVYVVSKHPIDISNLPAIPRINYTTDPSLKDLIDSWWKQTFDVPPNITMEVDLIDTCREMVICGLGYAIVPEICLKGLDHLYKYEISSKEGSPIRRKTWLIFRNSVLDLSKVSAFVDFIQTDYKQLINGHS